MRRQRSFIELPSQAGPLGLSSTNTVFCHARSASYPRLILSRIPRSSVQDKSKLVQRFLSAEPPGCSIEAFAIYLLSHPITHKTRLDGSVGITASTVHSNVCVFMRRPWRLCDSYHAIETVHRVQSLAWTKYSTASVHTRLHETTVFLSAFFRRTTHRRASG